MRCDRFRSKGMAYFMIGAFMFLVMAETVPAGASDTSEKNKGPVVRIKENGSASSAQQEQFETLMADGKKLYDDMENEPALQKFLQARALAVTKQQKSDVYFYLSLVYFTLLEEGRSNEFTNAVNMLIEVDYYMQPDPQVCPQRYIEMYQEIKKNYGILRVRSNPAGAEVYLNDSRSSSGKTPLTIAALAGEVSLEVKKGKKKAKDTLEVKAGEETQSPEYELKGKSSMLLVVGGILLAGGVGAAVLLGGGSSGETNPPPTPGPVTPTTGSVQISSNPSGAAIYLDGADTGNVTPHTLQSVSAGSHIVLLIKEGYLYFEEGITVTGGQTAVVNPELQKHVITFAAPDSGTTWMVGTEVDIVWETGDAGGIQAGSISGAGLPSTSPGRSTKVPAFSGDRPQTRTSMPHQAASGRDQRLSTRSTGTKVASRTSLIFREGTSPARRLPPSATSRSPFPSPGMDFQRMKTQGTSSVQILTSVKIDLYRGTTLSKQITGTTNNDGHFEWTVPKSLEDGTNYRVRISVAGDETIFFNSPKFTIRNAAVGIVTDRNEVGVLENQNATFQVKLSQQPSAQVEITVKRASGDKDVKISAGGTLVFSRSNWNTYKKVTLFATPDGDTQNGQAVIRLSGPGIPSRDIVATEVDLTEGPPKHISPADGTSFNHIPRTTTLKWQAVPGVSGYRVEVQYKGLFTWSALIDVTVTGTSYTFNFVGAQPGRWRVTAISGGGVQGPPSAWWGFVYTI